MTALIKFSDSAELEKVEPSKAQQIRDVFMPMADMLERLEIYYLAVLDEVKKNGITKDVTERAKFLRKDIAKVRIHTEKTRKAQKEEYLIAGRAIDSVANILKWAIAYKEKALKEIENHFEIEEKKQLDAIRLAEMQRLEELRLVEEKKAEAELAAKTAAEAAENLLIKVENDRLKKEAASRAAQGKIEAENRARAEAKQLEVERAEQQKREQKAREERETYEAKLRAEREKKDTDKINDLIGDLEALKSRYQFRSEANKQTYQDFVGLLDKVIKFIISRKQKNEIH